MVLVFTACAKQKQEPAYKDAAEYYEKAELQAADHGYQKALELLRKGLAKDTLDGFSPGTAKALNRKMTFETLTGNYFDALASHEMIEKRCGGMLPDTAETKRIRSKAALLAELGEFAEAEKSLMTLGSLSVRDSLDVARYRSLGGDHEKAFVIYNDLSVAADPVISLQAYTGLLELSLGASFSKAEAPSVYTHRITGLARKLVAKENNGNEKAAALVLRRAAMLLELIPAHTKDASYLYFKALSRARAAGDERLAQLLDFESNAVLANNPEVYARTLDYFERNNMPLARMAALLKQGAGGHPGDDERIRALKKGLNIYQHQVSPLPGYALVRLVDRSAEKLTEMLLSRGRYAEAFETDELRKLYVLKHAIQRSYDTFELPEEHEQLERQVERLGKELNALLQRLMNSFETGQGYESHATTIEAINKKRGKLYEKFAAVRTVSPLQAGKLALAPVTLRTVQQALDEGHAVLKIIESKHWCTVFLVQNNSIDVSRRKVDAALYRSRLRLFREHLAMSVEDGSARVAGDLERIWLTDLLIKPYTGRLRDINRLTVVAAEPVPAHLLGYNRFLVRDFPVSWIYSAHEFVRQASLNDDNGVEQPLAFYSAERYQEVLEEKLTSPHQAIFLLWKPFSGSEIEELRVLLALSMQEGGDPSDVLHQLAQNRQAESDYWLYLSEYGIRGR